MTILILCREPTLDVTALAAELERRGHQVLVAVPDQVAVAMNERQVAVRVAGRQVDVDVVFGWVSLHERVRGTWLLQAFRELGVLVINGAAVLDLGQNKFLASVRMARLGIPHIRSAIASSHADVQHFAQVLGLPIVVKPIVGAKGDGVQLVHDATELAAIAESYFARREPVYLQEPIDKPSRDIRVRVIDYRAELAFYRYAAPGQFVTNLALGGRWEPCPLTEPLSALAEQCARAFDAPVAGVDVLEDPAGALRVIEINVTPAITWPDASTVQSVCTLLEGAARGDAKDGHLDLQP